MFTFFYVFFFVFLTVDFEIFTNLTKQEFSKSLIFFQVIASLNTRQEICNKNRKKRIYSMDFLRFQFTLNKKKILNQKRIVSDP